MTPADEKMLRRLCALYGLRLRKEKGQSRWGVYRVPPWPARWVRLGHGGMHHSIERWMDMIEGKRRAGVI